MISDHNGPAPFAGPLPTVDANAMLQERSIQALRALLPLESYLFRDERTDDYGVDGALELRSGGTATNVRAQLQLKGRSNTRPNADGSVAVQVETSNLNYLLNGICPIYVLYRPESEELRFAFAKDEWAGIEATNPVWKSQKTVTIHFKRVLDSETLKELRHRIVEEAKMQRSVSEKLNGLREGAGQVVVDGQSLWVTSSQEALEMLSRIGQSLSNWGLSSAVIERARTIPTGLLFSAPRAALALAYAHFHLAHYHDASATLRRLLLTNPELDPDSRSLLDVLFISTKRMLGELDEEEYEGEMNNWATTAPPSLAIRYEISLAWSRYLAAVTASSEAIQNRALSTLRGAMTRGRDAGGAYNLHNIELLELTLEQRNVSPSPVLT